MSKPPPGRDEIFNQVCQLYEFSLAVGTSLDPEENCSTFFSRVMARRGLSYAALWLHENLDVNEHLVLVYSDPEREYSGPKKLNVESLPVGLLAARKAHCRTREALEAEAPDFLLPRGGSFALVPLAEMGFVMLAGNGERALWEPWQASQWQPIFEALARSVRGAYAHQRLRQEIDERLQAEQLAIRANQTKTDFLANMSHELRTPLTAILGFGEIASDETESSERRQHAVEVIVQNGQHLLRMVDDLLDLSQLDSGSFDIRREQVSLPDIFQDLERLLSLRAVPKGLSYSLCIDRVPRVIESDASRLRQVLFKVVGNSVKFTPSGSIRVSCRVIGADNTLSFEIADDGIGMTQQQLARAFEPFELGDAARSRSHGGAGLGLPLAQRLIRQLGGELVATSEVGRGSRFHVALPTRWEPDVEWLQPREQSHAPQSHDSAPAANILLPGVAKASIPMAEDASAANGPEGKTRVLLVEDAFDTQRLLSHFLRKAGVEVETAADGEIAVSSGLREMQLQQEFDVILMDIQLPKKDGYAATRELRELGYEGAIVALTAHDMPGEKERCFDAGCDGYATKPIGRRELLSLVEHWSAERARSL